jgi:hypothetical protein
MPTYRANITDKEQTDIERAADDSAIRVQSFEGEEQQQGETKMVKAYDGSAQAPNATGATSVVRQFGNSLGMGQGHVIGQHNDKPSVFETPGKA